jgi:FkbM family methyltransferase
LEPEARAYAQLERNISLNGLKNVRPFKVALGEETSSGHLYLDRAAATLMPSAKTVEAGEIYEQIEIVNGDEFWKLHELPIPRVVKIDVEGFEYLVLEGLRTTLSNPVVQLVVCEIHPYLLPAGTSPAMVKELMKSMGFDDISEFPRRREIQMIARRRASIDGVA